MSKPVLLTPEEFGAAQDPPRTGRAIRYLCEEGRVVGAKKTPSKWLIPERARIRGAGRRTEYPKDRGLRVSEFAKIHGRSRQRAYKLLEQGRIDGAKKTTHGWDIPEDAEWPADDGF